MDYDRSFTVAWMRRFADSVFATEGELTELDQRVGDGDFGANLSAGLRSMVARLTEDDGSGRDGSAEYPLAAAADAFLDDVGGTSGPLFGLLLHALASGVAEEGAQVTTAALATGASSGLAAIQRVGGAELGDKTLVDALAPAVRALRDCPTDLPPDAALDRAAREGWAGVRQTARLQARRGRASYLGERAVGEPDPGAVGVALLFASPLESVTRLPDLSVPV